jgi:hypothetical protein
LPRERHDAGIQEERPMPLASRPRRGEDGQFRFPPFLLPGCRPLATIHGLLPPLGFFSVLQKAGCAGRIATSAFGIRLGGRARRVNVLAG